MKVLIMAGGSGTRLWPLSRNRYPKQFLKLKGQTQSLFQMAIARSLLLCGLGDIYVLTIKNYDFIARLQIEELGLDASCVRVLVEPQPKNTLPAIYRAVREIAGNGDGAGGDGGGDSDVVVFTSDHLIRQSGELVAQIRAAAPLAKDYLFTFGIAPTRPDPAFGYIKPGRRLEAGYLVDEFREKPERGAAERYVRDGYYWNSGMFLFNTALFARQVERHAPEIAQAYGLPTAEAYFEAVASISIDYGLLEKSDRTAVLPLGIEWDDLGSFDTFYKTYGSHSDEHGNVLFYNEISINSSGNLVYTEKNKALALIGVNDLIVVDQDDAILICGRNDSQRVKEAVAALKAKGDGRADFHATEYRPWGSFTVLESGDHYKLKRITVLRGKQFSYQMHYHRSEHWTVVEGTATATIDGVERMVRAGETAFVPEGAKHRLRNNGRMLLQIIEVQVGQY
ncbi:MAG: mannose-1-phosphate guanylyltransferase/mannose-6-phosphate isomerase, partial [Clostridiales bacterium]|nr:mannose-1-phosphate guanylyltransferase/mannose-6-phosphate isomerase [Clostridiales bacterium]